MGGSFVLALKYNETEDPVYNALFVVQGHTYREKFLMVHSASTVRQNYVRVLMIDMEDIF